MEIQGRRRGRYKIRRLDRMIDDIREKGLIYMLAYVIKHRPYLKVGLKRRKIMYEANSVGIIADLRTHNNSIRCQ